MSNMVEIDIDFDYCGEVEMVLAHDECGEHEDVEFYRNDLLASDNAKLREQCAEMWEAIKTHERVNFATILRFGERLHKLGVIE